ncbi:hypothetical protein [Rhizobium skierniewicense]|uniref:hypothetical protein n=1 Tax=Rhizobium skierniewicense TaxID=984260 RepID=UPI001AEE3B94|nr:hypothetical protein [Rhizobium skierniewicense]
MILSGGITCISAVTNIVENHRRYRAVRFLPLVAARDRRPLVNGLKLFMIENRNAHYFRYAVMTCNELIPAFKDLRGPIQRLSRKISKWADEVCKEQGIKVLFRGIEFTRSTAAERDDEAKKQGRQSDLSERYGGETVLYHLHANVLYWPTRVIEDWTDFLRGTHKFIGAEWKDNGTIEKVEEIVKYCSKPADTEKASGEELVWLYRQTERLKICQPLGDFMKWMRGLKARREKIVRVRREGGDSELMRVKKGRRGSQVEDDEDQDEEIAADKDEDERSDASTSASLDLKETPPQGLNGGPVKNIVIGLTLPQWRHSPWAEPMIMVQNYDARTLSEEDGYHICEWQREAREWWNAANAPSPEEALEVARVALEAVQSGADMTSVDIWEAAKAACYIVHTCSSTVSRLNSIPYQEPHETIFEDQIPDPEILIRSILDAPNARERIEKIATDATVLQQQSRKAAEDRLTTLPAGSYEVGKEFIDREFPLSTASPAQLLRSAMASDVARLPVAGTSCEDENDAIWADLFGVSETDWLAAA